MELPQTSFGLLQGKGWDLNNQQFNWEKEFYHHEKGNSFFMEKISFFVAPFLYRKSEVQAQENKSLPLHTKNALNEAAQV